LEKHFNRTTSENAQKAQEEPHNSGGGDNVDNLPNEVVLLQPLRWCCVKCMIHHERDVREEQHHTYMWREQAIIE